jgi:hypothetical protein
MMQIGRLCAPSDVNDVMIGHRAEHSRSIDRTICAPHAPPGKRIDDETVRREALVGGGGGDPTRARRFDTGRPPI